MNVLKDEKIRFNFRNCFKGQAIYIPVMFGYDFNNSCTGLELQMKYTFYQDVIDTSSFVNFARFFGDFWNIQGWKYIAVYD